MVFFELAFLWLEVKAVFLQYLEHSSDERSVFFFGASIDEDIVYIDLYMSFQYYWP